MGCSNMKNNCARPARSQHAGPVKQILNHDLALAFGENPKHVTAIVQEFMKLSGKRCQDNLVRCILRIVSRLLLKHLQEAFERWGSGTCGKEARSYIAGEMYWRCFSCSDGGLWDWQYCNKNWPPSANLDSFSSSKIYTGSVSLSFFLHWILSSKGGTDVIIF